MTLHRPLLLCFLLAPLSLAIAASKPKLTRVSYHSDITGQERDYYVYLPRGYSSKKAWPVILFLHGNGERGDAKKELPYLLKHGPLFEAWSQKKLPWKDRDRTSAGCSVWPPEVRHRWNCGWIQWACRLRICWPGIARFTRTWQRV